MNLFIILKTFADLCLYSGAATIVWLWFGPVSSLFPQMICCTVGVAIAVLMQKRGILSYLGIPVTCACFFLCTYVADFWAVAPMVIYCIALIYKRQFSLEYYGYSNYFQTSLFIMAGMILFAGINVNWTELSPYIWVYLFVSIFLLRQLRLIEGGCQGHLLNVLMLIAVFVLGGALCGIVYGVYTYWGVFRWLFAWVELLLKAFAYVVSTIVVWCANIIRSIERPDNDSDVLKKLVDLFSAHLKRWTKITQFAEYIKQGEPNELAGKIWSAIFLVAALLTAWIFGRKLLRMMRRSKHQGSRAVYTESLHVAENRHREKSINNRAKVRALYRQFLTLVKKRGGKIHPNYTSRDVLETSIRFVDPENSRDLRKLYLSARYDENANITDEQVRMVRKLYHKLKTKR